MSFVFNQNIDNNLHERLHEIADEGIRCLAFTPEGGYVIISDRNNRFAHNIPNECFAKLKEMKGEGHEIQWVAFPPGKDNAWSIVSDRGFLNRNVPSELHEKMGEFDRAGHQIRCVAFHPDGGDRWSLITNRTTFNRNVPNSLHQLMQDFRESGDLPRLVAFDPDGGWLVASGTRVAALDIDDGAFAKIRQFSRAGRSVDVVAFDPDRRGWSFISNRTVAAAPQAQPEEGQSLRRPRITKGAASVVFFYMGDSKYADLAQDTTRLNRALRGYEHRVILKHNNSFGNLVLSSAAISQADAVMDPTRENLVNVICELADDGFMIDLWITSHGWPGGFRVSTGSSGSHGKATASFLCDELDPQKLGLTALPLRLVYQTQCYGASLNDTWRDLGAKFTVGTRFINFYPTRFGRFTRFWNDGVSARTALSSSDTAAIRTVVHSFMLANARLTASQWGGCPFLKTILSKHDCARDYFVSQWCEDPDEWQDHLSGKENMNHSSAYLTRGDAGITKDSTPRW